MIPRVVSGWQSPAGPHTKRWRLSGPAASFAYLRVLVSHERVAHAAPHTRNHDGDTDMNAHWTRLALATLALTSAAACDPAQVNMGEVCDGSDGIRLALQVVPVMGYDGADQQFGHVNGSTFIVVDGQCDYWVKDGGYHARIHELRPLAGMSQLTRVRTGTLDRAAFTRLARDLSLGAWQDLGGARGSNPRDGVSAEGSVHTNLFFDGAASTCSQCESEWGFDDIFAGGGVDKAIARLYDEGSPIRNEPLWTSPIYRLSEAESIQYLAQHERGTLELFELSQELFGLYYEEAGYERDAPINGCTSQRMLTGYTATKTRAFMDAVQDDVVARTDVIYDTLKFKNAFDPTHVYVLMVRDPVPGHEDDRGHLKFPTLASQGPLDVCAETL